QSTVWVPVGLPVPILCPGTRTPGERDMRRTVMACGAAMLVLAGGCSGDDPGPDPTAPPSSEPGGSGQPSSSPSVSESPEPFDPQQVDLAEQEWQFSTVYQDPVDVPLEGGEATGELGQWEGKFELGEDEPLYVDIDDDG